MKKVSAHKSIRYKFLAVTTLLLLICVSAYLLMATTVFKRDKKELVFDYSRSLVTNISSDIETLLNSVSDKMKLAAYFHREKNNVKKSLIKNLISEDKNIIFLANSFNFKKLGQVYYENKDFKATYALSGQLKENKEFTSSIPFQEIMSRGEAVWKVQMADMPPMIGYAKNVIEYGNKGKQVNQFAVIVLLKVDSFISSIQQNKITDLFIVNKQGDVLLSSNKEAGPFQDEELIKRSKEQNISTGVVKYNRRGVSYLGAYSKVSDKLFVLSRVDEAKAFSAVQRLVFRSILFASIVLTLAFIAAIFFSRGLTKPIDVLLHGMKKVSDGSLDTQISVKSNDEISVLANSFNEMIKDLKSSRDELEEINRSLEQKVKERTLQLEKQNIAVKSAQEALLKTTRLASVGEIAGRAAHEVLNPLTNIMSRVQKLQEKVSGQAEQNFIKELTEAWKDDYEKGGFDQLVKAWEAPSEMISDKNLLEEDIRNLEAMHEANKAKHQEMSEDIEFLHKESQRINRIVQSMRSMSVVKNEIKEWSLTHVLEESCNIMLDLASKYSVEIKLDCDEEVLVRVDKDEFIQSMTNLIRNGIQAICENGQQKNGLIDIHVSVEKGRALIHVSDNGMGVPEEAQKRIFESRFTTKTKEEGTGLGLNISRRFIRAFDGDIYLEKTKIGQGSTFVIELPSMKPAEEGVA